MLMLKLINPSNTLKQFEFFFSSDEPVLSFHDRKFERKHDLFSKIQEKNMFLLTNKDQYAN